MKHSKIGIIIKNLETTAYEIKSGSTFQNEYFKNLNYWQKTSNLTDFKLLYSGDLSQNRENGMKVLNWRREVE